MTLWDLGAGCDPHENGALLGEVGPTKEDAPIASPRDQRSLPERAAAFLEVSLNGTEGQPIWD